MHEGTCSVLGGTNWNISIAITHIVRCIVETKNGWYRRRTIATYLVRCAPVPSKLATLYYVPSAVCIELQSLIFLSKTPIISSLKPAKPS